MFKHLTGLVLAAPILMTVAGTAAAATSTTAEAGKVIYMETEAYCRNRVWNEYNECIDANKNWFERTVCDLELQLALDDCRNG
jgi:hypothetical protein